MCNQATPVGEFFGVQIEPNRDKDTEEAVGGLGQEKKDEDEFQKSYCWGRHFLRLFAVPE